MLIDRIAYKTMSTKNMIKNTNLYPSQAQYVEKCDGYASSML